MNSINIKRNTDINDIQNYFEELHHYKIIKEKVNLKLPKALDTISFPFFSEIIQIAISWVRNDLANCLILPIENLHDNDEIENLYRLEIIYPIVTFCWNNVAIKNASGKKLRPILRNFQNNFFRKMMANKPMIGDKLLLVNADHFSEGLGALPTFETNGEFSINQSLLNEQLKDAIAKVLKLNNGTIEEFNEIYYDVITVIYELMKNTFEWGREDNDGVPISPSIRGLYVRFYRRKAKNLIDEYKNVKPVLNFIRHDKVKVNEVGEIYLLELTVFDSGIGFVKKNPPKGDHASMDIIKMRLLKHHTSSTGIFKDKKGIGLDRVLKVMNNKGFVRIKTDGFCVYRDLIENTYQINQEKDYKKMQLFDWTLNSDTEYKEKVYEHGSSINILYPLKFNYRYD
jgi:hypothetical protein